MIPWEFLDSAPVPGSRRGELCLYRRGEEYSIRVDGEELMNSRLFGSEQALARISCMRVAKREDPRVVIGGLGMGYTLAAALTHLGENAEITVAELAPAVVSWNRGPLSHLADDPLGDPRVSVFEGDVAELIKSNKDSFDAIVLDVDNGPEGFTRKANDWLYSRNGLSASQRALRQEGILAVWSASPDRPFTKRLRTAGFRVEDLRVPAGRSGRGTHTIWIAQTR